MIVGELYCLTYKPNGWRENFKKVLMLKLIYVPNIAKNFLKNDLCLKKLIFQNKYTVYINQHFSESTRIFPVSPFSLL